MPVGERPGCLCLDKGSHADPPRSCFKGQICSGKRKAAMLCRERAAESPQGILAAMDSLAHEKMVRQVWRIMQRLRSGSRAAAGHAGSYGQLMKKWCARYGGPCKDLDQVAEPLQGMLAAMDTLAQEKMVCQVWRAMQRLRSGSRTAAGHPDSYGQFDS
eukprot:1152613-Pelagomonas_calceolata.AAC.1